MKKLLCAVLLTAGAFCSVVKPPCGGVTQAFAASRTRLTGNALRPGDCIGILATGSYADDEDFEGSIELLKAHGYRVKLAPSAKAMYEHFAGTDRKRAEDVNALFRDDEVKAILCVGGGYGEIPMPEGHKLETLISGEAEGIIVGGNLSLVTSLMGTPYELNGKGTLLLLGVHALMKAGADSTASFVIDEAALN